MVRFIAINTHIFKENTIIYTTKHTPHNASELLILPYHVQNLTVIKIQNLQDCLSQ